MTRGDNDSLVEESLAEFEVSLSLGASPAEAFKSEAFVAARAGCIESLRALLDGLAERHPEELGQALAEAVFWTLPFPGFLEEVLARGADPGSRGPDGAAPLHAARGAWAVDALVAAGADIEALDRSGRTPLLARLLAGDRRGPPVRLMRAGASLDAVDPYTGMSARDVASSMGLGGVVREAEAAILGAVARKGCSRGVRRL